MRLVSVRSRVRTSVKAVSFSFLHQSPERVIYFETVAIFNHDGLVECRNKQRPVLLTLMELVETGNAFSLKPEIPDDQVFHMEITIVGAVMQYIKIVNLDFRRKKYRFKDDRSDHISIAFSCLMIFINICFCGRLWNEV